MENENVIIDIENAGSINTENEGEAVDTVTVHLQNTKRKLKSLTDRIILLASRLEFSNRVHEHECISAMKYYVLGSNNNRYTIYIWKELDVVQFMCNCPDFVYRNVICKHIYWIGSHIFDEIEPQLWDPFEYDAIVINKWLCDEDSETTGRNEKCPICLETIYYDEEQTIRCKYRCNNSVHTICWNKYYCITGKTKCVVCRSETAPIIGN